VFNRILTICIAVAMALPSAAQSKAEGEKILQSFVPHCHDSTLKRGTFAGKLPSGYTAEQITLESTDPYCRFDAALVRLADGRWYLGGPWPIGGYKGTAAEKLRAFGWDRLGTAFIVESGGKDGGVEKLVAWHVTEAGRVRLDGWTDPAGTIFGMGDVAATSDDMRKQRAARLAPVLAKAPSRGPASASVTVVEFSDFQCPACKGAHDIMTGLMKKFEGKVRHVRADLPLVSSHPWAFAASVIGRAIQRQKPELFWDWKSAVYASQGDLNAFTIDQFGRNFAQDNGIDMARYDADVVSEEIRKEILDGVGVAYTLQISATPSFIVNDRVVPFGTGGKNLEAYLDELTAK
jgi:protein-disulfide isomerase